MCLVVLGLGRNIIMSGRPANAGKPWGNKTALHADFNNPSLSDEALAEKYQRNIGGIKGQRWDYGNSLRNQGLPDNVVVARCQYTIAQLNDPEGQTGWSSHGPSIIDKISKAKAKAKAKAQPQANPQAIIKKDVTKHVDKLLEDDEDEDKEENNNNDEDDYDNNEAKGVDESLYNSHIPVKSQQTKVSTPIGTNAKGQLVEDNLEDLDEDYDQVLPPPRSKAQAKSVLKPAPKLTSKPAPPTLTSEYASHLVEMRLQTAELRKISASLSELVELMRFK